MPSGRSTVNVLCPKTHLTGASLALGFEFPTSHLVNESALVLSRQDFKVVYGHRVRTDGWAVHQADVSKSRGFWKNPCSARPAEGRVNLEPAGLRGHC